MHLLLDIGLQLQNFVGMDPAIIIKKIEAFADETGMKESSVCQLAFSNPRYLESLRARVRRLPLELEKFEKFVAGRKPSSEDAA
ncbi:hypothetical protein A7A09_019120 [Paracoccus methylarcula]|uniref:Uncharacterized protein n=1 Tax=Paracoccus methylarcula TaxID=72022 RepID=A0A3R7NVP3_9RHOB|nr:hypothetical protein A7A09_019120 [Paracoccus methylarcula]